MSIQPQPAFHPLLQALNDALPRLRSEVPGILPSLEALLQAYEVEALQGVRTDRWAALRKFMLSRLAADPWLAELARAPAVVEVSRTMDGEEALQPREALGSALQNEATVLVLRRLVEELKAPARPMNAAAKTEPKQ